MEFRIETERLIIRPFEETDIAPSYEMNLDAEVSRYTGDGGVVSKAEIERRIRENVMGDYQKHGYGRWAVELKGGERFIGFTGLKYLPDVDEVDLGFRFKKKYWGRGLATESGDASLRYGFETLGLHRVIGWVLPLNGASIRVLQKLGFGFEKDILEEGETVSQFALSKEQWMQNAWTSS